MSAPVQYLSRGQLAERIGVQPDSLSKYRLPEPDALVGRMPGWLPATVDAWNAARPGRGNWRGRAAAAMPGVRPERVAHVEALARQAADGFPLENL